MIEEDNEMKLYFGWAFAWASHEVKLAKGPATLRLRTTSRDRQPRQIDAIVLTTDSTYRPRIKERPPSAAREFSTLTAAVCRPISSRSRVANRPSNCRRRGNSPRFATAAFCISGTSATPALSNLVGDKPDRVRFPYNIADAPVRSEFEKKYAGRNDVPIFCDPRIVPTFHGVGAGVFATDPKTGDVSQLGRRFADWLDKNPTGPGRP